MSVNEVDDPEITKWDPLFTELLINAVTPGASSVTTARCTPLPTTACSSRRFAHRWPVSALIDFSGRTGYVRTAAKAGVPIVPAVSIGGQETQLFVTRGNWLAKRLGLKRIRMEILPVTIGFPFGLTVFFPANIPLPAKIVYQVLEPIDIVAQFGKDADIHEVDSYVRSAMQTALDRLRGQRRFPILG